MRYFACVLLAAAVLPLANPRLLWSQEEAPAARVARLVRRLGSESYVERSQASQALRELGPASRRQLEQAVLSTDPEVRLRALELLRELKTADIWAPSLCNLKLQDKAASKALAALSQQTGNCLLVGDHYGAFRDGPVTLDCRNTPFWEALDSICRQTESHVRPHYDQRKPGLVVVSGAMGKTPLAWSGPVRGKIVGARRVFIEELDYESLESELTHTFQFNLQMLWEDRLRLVAYRPQLELAEAVTDTGVKLTSPQAPTSEWKTATSTTRQVAMSLRLQPPPIDARRLKSLRLTWGLIAVGDLATLDITDWKPGQTHTQDDVRLTVLKAERTDESRYEMVFVFSRDLALPEPRDVLYQENTIELLDGKGAAWRKLVHDWRLTDDGLKVSATFTPESENTEPKTLRFTYPRLRSQHDLEIEFRDVPLPVGRPE